MDAEVDAGEADGEDQSGGDDPDKDSERARIDACGEKAGEDSVETEREH